MRKVHIFLWFTVIFCSLLPIAYFYVVISAKERPFPRFIQNITYNAESEIGAGKCHVINPGDLSNFPWCEEKLKWLKSYWKSHKCYSEYGVDGSICSFRSYFSNVEIFCPPLPGYQIPSFYYAKLNSKMEDLLRLLTDNPENYSFIRARITRMFEDWSYSARKLIEKYPNVMNSRKKLTVIVHMGFLNKENKLNFAAGSDKGGPLGELVQWTDSIVAMYILGHHLLISSERKTLTHHLRAFESAPPCPSSSGNLDLIVTDIMGLRSFRNHKQFLVNNKCRLRLIDSFGTHVELNTKAYFNSHKKLLGGSSRNPWGGHGLVLQQYWTLFPHTPDNSFLGFIVEKSNALPLFDRDLKPTMLVYGKLKYIWNGTEDVIETLKEVSEVHATVSDGDNSTIFDKVVNHGFLTSNQFYSLLNSVRVFVGLGFPFEGPAPLEAIANGAVFINPRYSIPKSRNNSDFLRDKPTLRKWTSQVPYLERIGEPYVITVDIHDKIELKKALRKALSTRFPGFVPEEFTMEGMLLRVGLMLEKQDFCSAKVRHPNLKSLKTVLAPTGENCEKACELQNLVCEPTFFQIVNNRQVLIDSFRCEHIEEAPSVIAPYNCTLQSTSEMFSCASYPSDSYTSRVCPCRDYIKGQQSICKSCV